LGILVKVFIVVIIIALAYFLGVELGLIWGRFAVAGVGRIYWWFFRPQNI
jgi:hypothetical protein